MELSDISHIISICNAVIAVLVMQLKSMKTILVGHITVNLIGAISFFLLGGYSGASICVIAIIQCVVMFVYNKKDIKPHLPVIGLFVLAYIACSVIYYQSPVDILAALAALFFAISVTRTRPSVARLWNALNPVTWMAYDICIGGYGSFVMHVVIFISIAIAILRLDIIPKYKAKKQISDKSE
ncbi:MAG: YgjV family protein [Clostridia bacterium]|nr:YgjV family protein [Clostridia bacterium]